MQYKSTKANTVQSATYEVGQNVSCRIVGCKLSYSGISLIGA